MVSMEKPKFVFTDTEVLEWAATADRDPRQFARMAITWPQERCDALGNFVQKMFGRRMQDRGTLQNLARVLTGVRQHRSDQEKETQDKAKRLEESEAHRKALADIVNAHPKGGQIGAGGAKLPGQKGR
jgi:hypothetical protein